MAVLYSTGPIEEAGAGITNIIVKVLNNSPSDTATVRVRVFDLNGTKTRIFRDTLIVPAQSSAFVQNINVNGTEQFEVQFRIELDGATNQQIESFVLPAVFGKNNGGRIQPETRVLTSELELVRPINND